MTDIGSKYVIVVSGLPRSGTSMMMNMLKAGGVALLQDGARKPDEDNPGGYYELETVKDLHRDNSCLAHAAGRGVKVISMQLKYLPKDKRYKIIFLNRKLDEVLASQRKMLERRGQKLPTPAEDRMIGKKFDIHLLQTRKLIQDSGHMDVLYLNYADVVGNAREAAIQVKEFIGPVSGRDMDIDRMASVVDDSLYRQRK